ncbi:uncharacterized protein LOC110713446 [Chenopodium quinoa]|uniref:uncharacterized protein LOC110713446 n=1 Tax=Chenopodium quinoa TaxID=63459 RepID=UPI000B797BC5|nr:uncharacterized protein LOC110713446 [Chenopodium quinoa]
MGFRKPLPPVIRVLPGRPKSRKRKKEQGEDQDKVAPPKKTTRCSKCKQLGHNKKTCKNEAAAQLDKQIDKGGIPPSETPWVKEQRKKREVKELSKVAASGTQQAAAAAASSQHGSQSAVDHPIQSTQQSQTIRIEVGII